MLQKKTLKRIGLAFVAFIVLAAAVGIGLTSYATPTLRNSIQTPVFTIGDHNYALAMHENKKVVKFGPLPFGIYPGGIAFRDHKVAAEHLDDLGKRKDGWGVYRLSGDFQLDTYEYDGRSYINKSLLVVATLKKGTESGR